MCTYVLYVHMHVVVRIYKAFHISFLDLFSKLNDEQRILKDNKKPCILEMQNYHAKLVHA